MMKSKQTNIIRLVGVLSAVAVAYVRWMRPWHLRWGATQVEADRPLPGDDLIPHPAMAATHAITIQAPVDQVWPWVAQMGQGRGGFYSYDWLENIFGMNIHNTDALNPEWQNPQVGDTVLFWKGVGIPILQIEPPHLIVLGGSFTPQQPIGGSWTFLLESPEPRTTRLIVRARVAGFSPQPLSLALYRLFMEPTHFIMERGMLLGIKSRAEKSRN